MMKTKLKIAVSLTIVQTLLMGTTIASAQNGRVVNDSWLNENYTKREVMVEVRDGEKIYTAIYEPTDEYLGRIGKQKSPIMLTLRSVLQRTDRRHGKLCRGRIYHCRTEC